METIPEFLIRSVSTLYPANGSNVVHLSKQWQWSDQGYEKNEYLIISSKPTYYPRNDNDQQ